MSAGDFGACAERIAATGLVVRGAFHVAAADGVPPVSGAAARTVVLIGNVGTSMWPELRAAPELEDGAADPLDRWSERVIAGLGRELDALAVFPFKGPPYYPFLRWARRAEPVSPSPLGLLIHPRYGLWHAYRGALVFTRRLAGLPNDDAAQSPCLTCADQPCLSGCPVDAFGPDGFDVEACVTHLSGPNRCEVEGCLARNACPAGKPFQYEPEQHRFHLRAFFKAQRR